MKKCLIAFLMVCLAVSAFAGGGKEQGASSGEMAGGAIKNPDTFVNATIGTVDSLDPAKAYDTASGVNIALIYESLITYKGTTVDEYAPVLATEVPTQANGGISADGKTYRFHIRQGVKFHDGSIMTPEDVEYSFERCVVVDPDGGPDWMWDYFFLGTYGTRDGDGNINVDFADIDNAVEVDGNDVVFHLAVPAPFFLSVVANTFGSIVNKDFVIAQGGWDGTEATWKDYNNPATNEETLWDVANGTGPYMLDRWEKGVELAVTRFDGYWGPKPAIKNGIYKIVEEWSTRKLMLLQGDADMAVVSSQYYDEMDQEKGLTVYRGLPSLAIDAWGFNQDIQGEDNPAIYSGQLDGEGVPPDFFSDINVRKGFAACFDEDTYLNDVLNGYAVDPVTPIVNGLPFKDDSVERIPYDLDKAAEYFKNAWGGQVWEKGFKLDLLYNSGNDAREAGTRLLAEALHAVNPKFVVNSRGVEWAVYLDNIRSKAAPVFFIGWLPDYPDPDNYVYPYMHSTGTYAGRCSYSNPRVDKLIEDASIEPDPAKRATMYAELQRIWVEDAPGFTTSQTTGNRYFKDWVHGAFYNPMQQSAYQLLPLLTKE